MDSSVSTPSTTEYGCLTNDRGGLCFNISRSESLPFPELPINGDSPMQYEIITKEQFNVINEVISGTIVFIAVIGVILNSLNIKTFLMMGIKDGVTVTFLTLAFSDFCFNCLTCIQSTARLCISIENKYGVWFSTDPFVIDIYSNALAVCIYTISTFTTAFLAIARCMCIAKPLKFKNMFTRNRCFLVFIFFCLFSLILYMFPIGLTFRVVSKFDPIRNASRLTLGLTKERELVKDIVVMFSYLYLSVITEIIIIVCVVIMVSKLRESVKFRQAESMNEQINKKESATKLTGKEKTVVLQIVSISAIFIVCNLLKSMHSMLNFFDPEYDLNKPRQYLYLTMASVRVAFDCLNSTVNFFVYIFFNSRFRALCFKCKIN